MKKIIALALGALMSVFVFGCKRGEEEDDKTSYQIAIISMETTAYLTVTDDFGDETVKARYESLCADVNEELNQINSSLSVTVEQSAISRFNECEAGEKVLIDQTSYEVLTIAKQMYELTDGYYNPAVYYSVAGFKFNMGQPEIKAEDLPTDEQAEMYADLASHFGELQLEHDSDSDGYYAVKPDYTVEDDGKTLAMKLDLGGIGKGYAVDKVNELMSCYGFEYGTFNFGASSIAVKSHYKNGHYNLGVNNPRNRDEANLPAQYVSTTVEDECLSSSGDNENYYLLGDRRYCHIMNPKTGKPVSLAQIPAMSSTVIGGLAAEDDALTTALMAMASDKGAQYTLEFINENLSERRVIVTLQYADGYRFITNYDGWEVEDPRFTRLEF